MCERLQAKVKKLEKTSSLQKVVLCSLNPSRSSHEKVKLCKFRKETRREQYQWSSLKVKEDT